MYFTKTPSLASYILKGITWKIATSEKVIYLTFDDGPTPEITEWVLGELKKFNAMATFFCIGKNIEKHPEIFQKILSENHSVGNHSFDHLNGWKTSTEKYTENVYKCKALIERKNTEYRILKSGEKENETKELPTANCQLPTTLFRPPYGKILPSQLFKLKSPPLGGRGASIVMWDVLSGDFDPKISGEKCFMNVKKNAKKGSIVVFHDSPKAARNLFYALPKTLEYFSEMGYKFLSLTRNSFD